MRVTALAQIAQAGCAASTFGGIPKLLAHSPGQPALGGPDEAGRLKQMNPRGTFQPPQFCDFVILYDSH